MFGKYIELKEKFYIHLYKIIAFTSINIAFSLFFLFIYIYRRKEKYYLFFSSLSLSIALWLIGMNGYILHLIDNRIIYYVSTYVGSCFILISIMLFIHEILGVRKIFLVRLIIGLLIFEVIWIIIELLVTGYIYYFSKYLYMIHITLTLLITVCYTVLCVVAFFKKIPYSLTITAGILCLALPTLIAVVDFLRIYRVDTPIAEGFFLMSMSFATVLASRYASVFNSLEKANADLLILDKMKDDFLATTSHELRTPLHGIMGLSQTLIDGSPDLVTPAQKENLELICSEAKHLNDMVSEILDFSKISAGKVDLFLEYTKVEEVASTVVSLLSSEAEKKGITLKLECRDVPKIIADRKRLRQVLINLVGNAIKFSDGGTVTITIQPKDDRGVRIFVCDEGRGIDTKDLDRIWDPFVQAEDSDTRVAGGTGLGLAISKNLVELHGGSIRVESESGKGSRFIVDLPESPGARGISRRRVEKAHDITAIKQDVRLISHEKETNTLAQLQSFTTARILAVDDDEVNLRVMKGYLDVAGYEFITATNGHEALEILETQDVDIVLLDLMLPGISGYEVCKKIREDAKTMVIPVIMVTAKDTTTDLVRGFITGANDYITKPFNREELLVRIENQLAIKQMLEAERSMVRELRTERDGYENLFQRSLDIKQKTLQMLAWERLIQDDMDIARAFQDRLMSYHRNVTGVETYVYYRPLMKLGGDIYDIIEVRPGVLRVFLADATGHGITASLNTVKILSEYSSIKEVMQTPEEVLNFLNHRFIELYRDYKIIFTCIIADIDIAHGKLSLVSAGHPQSYLLSGNEVTPLKPRGPIICLSSIFEYRQVVMPVNNRDLLIFYTDGLLELIDSQYRGAADSGFDALKVLEERIASINKANSLEEICKSFVAGAESLSTTRNRGSDDITIVALRKL
ncbi:MAG TPA: SpoIIE family protein phosphatase [Spirochaetota bacterium]|nr:SpoIIE family protein phosphatase [Spirochaetota bacterium]